MRKYQLFITLLCFCCLSQAQTWDIMDKAMTAWDVDGDAPTNKKWSFSTNKSLSGFTQQDVVAQNEGYVNIAKMPTGFEGKYAFIVSSAMTLQKNKAYTVEFKVRVNPIDKATYPDEAIPTSNATNGGHEANQLSIRMNGKIIPIYLWAQTAESEGFVSHSSALKPGESEKYRLNTSEWHVYRLLISQDNTTFDVYVDNHPMPIFAGVPTTNKSGTNIFRLGAETYHRCNLDVEYVKMATGDYCTLPQIRAVSLSSDSHVVGHERTISVDIEAAALEYGEEIVATLIDGEGRSVIDPVKAIVRSNKARIENLVLPADLPLGIYQLKVGGVDAESPVMPKSADYYIVAESPIGTKLLPQVEPVGFTIDIDDYQYKAPSNEYIFPSVVDTKKHTADGKFSDGKAPLDRYYLFYTPHENPGGMYLATAPTLDGPWTERNTVIDLDWARAVQGSVVNTATHISSCQVVWNDVYNKYFMYFHGPNTTTHYATSDNLVDWTFGKSILNAQDFGSKGDEASYAKVFEHAVPGLDNKYIIMLMICENGMRWIYWGHSKDGIDWTCIQKPLISPNLEYKKIPGTDTKPSYSGGMGSNVSGPWFMESNGRYFVFFHGSSGNICVAEVGKSLDMEVHWGEYLKAENVIIDKDEQGNPVALPRVASPFFIQDDDEKWYLFFEAGTRLGANIAYAKDPSIGTGVKKEPAQADVSLYPTVLQKNEPMTVTISEDVVTANSRIEIVNMSGYKVSQTKITGIKTVIPAPSSAGVYALQVVSNNEPMKVLKIIVK